MGCSSSNDGSVPVPKADAGRTMVGPHLKTPECLVNWPQFPAGCDSLLSKALTKEVWDEYHDKSDSAGVSFKTCIFSGCKNPDSHIGAYAGSANSYTCFNKLFDKIIEDYHGHGVDGKHVTDMTSEGLNAPPLTEEDQAFIKSTRIRTGRNLAAYPLGPGVTKEQRLAIMTGVTGSLNELEGDLKGSFYPIEGMNADIQKQLIDDHFLFMEGDRFLEACNLNRDWPSGRGIFHNDAKTFLVWINEEDQLRIISMQQGADIFEVFDRLCRGTAEIEKRNEFARNDHIGCITSCPTNLGTALRASVHIKLPLLGADKEAHKAIADKFNVQIRGSAGETAKGDPGVYDISNKRRLGISEKELVQDMYNGVVAMIEAEKALMNK
jgi:creatine kinase/arginine kinase